MKIEKEDKKRRLYIKTGITLAVLSFLFLYINENYIFYNTASETEKELKKEIPENFDFGSISDSIYCNDFFKFKTPIPKGFKGEYKKYDYIEKSILERDSIPIAPRFPADIRNCNLLILEPEIIKINWLKNFKETGSIKEWENYNLKKRRKDLQGSDFQLVISVHNLFGASLSSYTQQFENLHNPDYDSSKTKTISGISFREYHGIESQGDAMQETTYRLMGGKNKEIISYNTQIHDFAFSIDLFYTTEEQKHLLLEIVENISFY